MSAPFTIDMSGPQVVNKLNNLWDRGTASLYGSSSTPLSISTGNITLVTSPNLQFARGGFVTVSSNADPAQYMAGQVDAYDPVTGTLSVNIAMANGSGIDHDWSITIGGMYGAAGANGHDGLNGTNGVNGTNGFDGTSVTGATLDENYHLRITLSNGKIADAGYVRGDIGPANTLAIGAVTVGTPGASITGAAPNQTLNLTLPQGIVGPTNSLTIGTVTSGDAPAATIAGNAPAQILNLVLPKGNVGDKGDPGISVASTEINSSGHLILTMSNAAVHDVGLIKGANGTGSGTVTSVNSQLPDMSGVVYLNKNNIGLENVDNTADVNKPVSAAMQVALDEKVSVSAVGGTVASLAGGKVPLEQLPIAGVPIGAMLPMLSSTPNLVSTVGGTFLRTGVASLASDFPLAPQVNATTGLFFEQTTLVGGANIIAYGNGTFIAVRQSSCLCFVSMNRGATFISNTLPVIATWVSITYGNGYFVLISTEGVVAISSDNGATWLQKTLPGGSTWASVAYGNGTFVAVGNNSPGVATSVDNGTTWIQRTSPSSMLSAVVYGNGVFVAVGGYGTAGAATSADNGVTWIQRTTPSGSGQWNVAVYGNGTFLIVPTIGFYVAISTDNGSTWVNKPLSYNQYWTTAVFGNNTFMVAGTASTGANNTYITSSDNGNTWSRRTLPVTSAWRSGAFGEENFVLVSLSDAAAVSLPPNTYTDTLNAMFADATAQTGPFYMRVA